LAGGVFAAAGALLLLLFSKLVVEVVDADSFLASAL
jgi:hypothetical protein